MGKEEYQGSLLRQAQLAPIMSAIKDIRLEENPGKPERPNTASSLIVVDLGRLPKGVTNNTTGLELARDKIALKVEKITGLKPETSFGHENGNWSINLAFEPKDHAKLQGHMDEIAKVVKKDRSVHLN